MNLTLFLRGQKWPLSPLRDSGLRVVLAGLRTGETHLGGTAKPTNAQLPDPRPTYRDALHSPNPVPKCSYMITTPSKNSGSKCSGQQGQVSIFFASSLIVLISIIAFVINIGLYVKAKINLQNATDAAAYAGASVQARMLNRIGYMNWEMRNTYKEWMFKYYVLGNLNIDNVANPSAAQDIMNFGMRQDPNLPNTNAAADIYNFPSVCIQYAGVPTNVCRNYAIPGIPRFEPTNLVGIDETTASFIDAIVKEKTDDCSKRSQLNFNVTNMWAYNIPTADAATNTFADAPQIAADRIGAWPRAVELAIRTRSLESAVNRPPVTAGICSSGGQGMPGCQPVQQFESQKHYGNERPTKAFWSAYRNLGNENDSEMKATFTLTEIAPTPAENFPLNSLSTMLMGDAASNRPKHYLDLKLKLVNYATFFTALISVDNTLNVSGQTVRSEGACDVSKIAVPVPGYPLGFYKSPDVLTYYAVKGEAFFQGLFSPFQADKIKLTAFAAAKPMGGRIGPALFMPSGETMLSSRSNATKRRSTSYISGLDLENLPAKGTGAPIPLGQYVPGMPIPFNTGTDAAERFWIKNASDNIGGWISGPEIVFGIPNLVYDYIGQSMDPNTYQTSESTNVIDPKNADRSKYGSGLYKREQFIQFKGNLVGSAAPDEITDSLVLVRAPTTYEAANYTIPFPSNLSGPGGVDSFGFISGVEQNGSILSNMYAPLYGPQEDAIFKNSAEVTNAIFSFMRQQVPAMRKYRDSMNKVAEKIYYMNNNPGEYVAAARRISDYVFTGPTNASNPQSCGSIAGTFLWYYFGGEEPELAVPSAGCPKSLRVSLEEYFNSTGATTFDPSTYAIEYTPPANSSSTNPLKDFKTLLTGYMPGPARGATEAGVMSTLSSSGPSETVRRTGYSTKFVTLRSLGTSGNYNQASSGFGVYSEGDRTPVTDLQQTSFRNPLDLQQIPATVNH
jgi:hypothetical protein